MVSKQIADSIRKDLDGGRFADATNATNLLKAFQQNISNMCQQNGGRVHVFLPEWMVMECPQSVAEQIPQLLASFNEQIGHSMACGIGLDFSEAVKAVHQSERSGEICLYEEKTLKSEGLSIPPNLFDYTDQSVANNDGTNAEEQEFASAPDFQNSVKLAQAQIQAIIQQLGGDAQEKAQQQIQQIQQQQAQAQQAQQQPRDLTEALHGQQIQGRNPYSGDSAKPEDKKESKSDSKETKKDEPEASEEDDGNDEVQQKLGAALLHIKQQIPQLMDLAEKNPDAFKQSMSLVQKLLNLTKKTKGQVEKSEMEILTEDLNKKIIHLPVGTIKDRKKKVLVNGKAVWRSIISGEVRDLQGQPVSVKSSNLSASKGKQAGEK